MKCSKRAYFIIADFCSVAGRGFAYIQCFAGTNKKSAERYCAMYNNKPIDEFTIYSVSWIPYEQRHEAKKILTSNEKPHYAMDYMI